MTTMPIVATVPFDPQIVFGVQVIALISTIAFFLSGSSTALKIHQQKSVKNVNFIPFLMTALNCFLWCTYGILKRDMLLCIVNSVGCITQALYMFVFLQNCDNKPIHLKKIFFVGTGAAVVLFFINFGPESIDPIYYLGLVASSITVIMFGSPLSTMSEVIRSQNAETMSPILSVMTVLVSGIWFIYGYMINDRFVQIPNLLGCLLGIGQLYLIKKYGSSAYKGSGDYV